MGQGLVLKRQWLLERRQFELVSLCQRLQQAAVWEAW